MEADQEEVKTTPGLQRVPVGTPTRGGTEVGPWKRKSWL